MLPFNSPLTLLNDTPSVKRESSSLIQLFSQAASPIPVPTGMVSPSAGSEDGSVGFVTPFVSSPISSDADGSREAELADEKEKGALRATFVFSL